MSRIEFRLPSLGADMEQGKLAQWLKQPGDAVRRGEAIAVVETDKGMIDVECFHDGVLERHVVAPGAVVPVGTVLAWIEGEADAMAIPSRAPEAAAAGPAAPSTRVRSTPAARQRAQALGVDLASVAGSGPDGLVRIEDVERQVAERPGASAGAVGGPPAAPGGMRAAIAAAMSRAKREIPHYYLSHDVDFFAARAFLEQHNAGVSVADRLLEAVLLVKAIARAAAEVEGFNGHYGAGGFQRAAAVHVGTAIALRGGGLVAPALLDADRKDLATLMREFSDLVTRVRAGHMRSGELAAPTITLTSLGAEGVDALFPVINPPQVAIVGAGSVRERPWVARGELLVRPVLTLGLAADHRVTDGRAGARFLRRIEALLADPATL
jgi:pyruvate dehydrogenase E2 component (dihydrolipoamide acetyltransferase)